MRGEAMELREDLPGGRRELRMLVGPFAVTVAEIPGRSLNAKEWHDIELARRSYSAMWGAEILAHDVFDGRDGSPYDTHHYIAWVRDGAEPCKLLTMRRVTLRPSELTARERSNPLPLLPVDLTFWGVRTPEGCVPLWEVLRDHARRLAPQDALAEFRIASIGRTGTFPYRESEQTPRKRERTGIAFAAIQLLMTHADPVLLYVCSLCPEFQTRVLGVFDLHGVYVAPAFTRTEEVLGLPTGAVHLQNSLEVVREHRLNLPGYWIDHNDAAGLIAEMLDEGRLIVEDFGATILRLVHAEARAGRDMPLLEELGELVVAPDHKRLAEILTRPLLFKHMIPLLIGDRRPALASIEELRTRLVVETRARPFSATMLPRAWASSAWAIVEAAGVKHGGAPLGGAQLSIGRAG
jgi:hypothetical protein